MYLDKLAREILEKEQSLWRDPFSDDVLKPKKRVGDHNLIAMNEIYKASGFQLKFDPADKSKKHAGINLLRTIISNDRIVIHPRCKVTVRAFIKR